MEVDNELLWASMIGAVVFSLVFLVFANNFRPELLTFINGLVVFCTGFTFTHKVFAYWDKQIEKNIDDEE